MNSFRAVTMLAGVMILATTVSAETIPVSGGVSGSKRILSGPTLHCAVIKPGVLKWGRSDTRLQPKKTMSLPKWMSARPAESALRVLPRAAVETQKSAVKTQPSSATPVKYPVIALESQSNQ